MTPIFAIAPNLPDRFRAAGKFLLFAVLFTIFMMLIGKLAARLPDFPSGFAGEVFKANLAVTTATLILTLVLARQERRAFRDFGLGGNGRFRAIFLGAAAGFLLVSAVLFGLIVFGCASFNLSGDHGLDLAKHGLGYLVMFVAVGMAEETLCRGYPLVKLSQAISFWPAQLVMSVFFALTHSNNSGENFTGLASTAIFSLLMGYSFLRFGSLWFAIGLHIGWDYTQSFLCGVPDSGLMVPDSLLIGKISGPAWFTGGSVGPEGSFLIIPVFIFLIWLIRRETAPSRHPKSESLAPLPPQPPDSAL